MILHCRQDEEEIGHLLFLTTQAPKIIIHMCHVYTSIDLPVKLAL